MKKILLILSLFFLWKDNAMAVVQCKTQSDCGNGYTCVAPIRGHFNPGFMFCSKTCSHDSDCTPMNGALGCGHWGCANNVCRCH